MSTRLRALSGWSCGTISTSGSVARVVVRTPVGARQTHAGIAVGDDGVDVAGGQLCGAVGRLEVREREHEVGMGGPQARERVGDEVLGGAGERAGAQGPELPGGLADRERAHLGVGEQSLGALEQDEPRCGGCDAARAADEQFAAEFRFKLGGMLGDRGRGVAERFGRRGERSEPRGLHERAQPQQVHALQPKHLLWSGQQIAALTFVGMASILRA